MPKNIEECKFTCDLGELSTSISSALSTLSDPAV